MRVVVGVRPLSVLKQNVIVSMNRPGMSGDSTSWEGWGHVRWFVEEEVSAGAA